MKTILGISAFYHDSAATILIDGKIIAAAQEERFTRKKHDSSYPFNAIEFVLDFAKIKLKDIDQIIFFEKPFLKFERLLETYVAFAPRGFKSFCMAMPVWLKDKLFQKKMLFNELKRHDNNFNDIKKIYFSDHHLSHAASAFFPSPFEEAIVLTADGVGEWATTTVAIGKGNKLEIKKEIHFPHSLGLLYSAFTYYTGFKVNSGEYKLMGLAPYGNPIYEDKIKKLIDIKDDGTFRLDQKYFNYATGLTMTNKKFNNLFGQKPRNPKNEKITQFHMDIAASIQKVTEEIMIKLAKSIREEYGIKNLCLAGGVALNCSLNGRIKKEKIFKNIFIQPASGDAGISYGSCLVSTLKRKKLKTKRINNFFTGTRESERIIKKNLIKRKIKFKKLNNKLLHNEISKKLLEGKIIGVFRGPAEFGPRALGNRSIISKPYPERMKDHLNKNVKFREFFRPFAPMVLNEKKEEYFDLNQESPHMLIACKAKMKNRNKISAVVHVDNSCRVQTLTNKTNPFFYKLLNNFYQKSGVPVILNTSFNIKGQPIVNDSVDAIKCFKKYNIDVLILENFIIEK